MIQSQVVLNTDIMRPTSYVKGGTCYGHTTNFGKEQAKITLQGARVAINKEKKRIFRT